MSRLSEEQTYWNTNALDKDVDVKYICDIDTDSCLQELGKLDGKVLEIGCGVGRLMQTGYYGIDISQNMLDIAKKRRPKSHLKLTTGEIPYEDSYFDNIYSFLVFQHLKPPSVKKYINESFRSLKKGGKFKFQFIAGQEREPFSNHYTKEEITSYMNDAGYKKVLFSQSKLHQSWVWAEAVK